MARQEVATFHALRDALKQTGLGCFGTKTPSGRCHQVCPDVRIGRLRFFVPDFGHIEPLEPLVLPCESRQIHRPALSRSGTGRYAIRPGSHISMILMFPLWPFYQP